MLMPVAMLVALFAISFLLGSIPWGVIVSRVFYKKDIRDEGSGNIGATNAVRGLGLRGGVPVFLLDVGKGAAAGAVAWFLWAPLIVDAMLPDSIVLFTGITGNVVAANDAIASGQMNVLCACTAFLACTLGHIFSPWLKFHGGKGISVAFGCEFFALGPIAALIDLGVFLVFAVGTRYVSLGSIMAAVAVPFLAVWVCWNCWPAAVMACIAAAVVIWAHRGNISRLVKGEERRFGSSEEAAAPADASQDARPRRERRAEERRARKGRP